MIYNHETIRHLLPHFPDTDKETTGESVTFMTLKIKSSYYQGREQTPGGLHIPWVKISVF